VKGRSDRAALRISIAYALAAAAWILASDRALDALVGPERAAWLQTFKGWFFVLVTGVLLFLLVRRELGSIARSEETTWQIGRALEVTNETLQKLADASPAAVTVIDPDGTVRLWSRAAERIFGWSAEEAVGRPLPVVPDEGMDEHLELRARLLEGHEVVETELRRRRKDGSKIDVLLNAAPIRDASGNVTAIIGVLMDITDRKQAEDTLRETVVTLRETDEERRRLLSRLVDAREEEHKRIAADVHDGPVQKMAAVGLRLETLRRRLTDPEDRRLLDELARTVETTTYELRHLLLELVPPVLASGGLAPALRMLLDDLADKTGMDTRLEYLLVVDPDESVSNVCFRVVQEALRNIRKHADARTVEILVEGVDGGTRVAVRDDGHGFEPGQPEEPGHLGVAGMRERAELAGGRLEVHSVTGEGTTVELWLPREESSGPAQNAIVDTGSTPLAGWAAAT
jgi:PAS domain S-box-containing protein